MFSGIFSKKERKAKTTKHFRYRLESCVNTILDLNDRLGDGKIRPDIIEQFRNLKKSFIHLQDGMVNEKEVSRIEEATNELLQEVGKLYGEKIIKELYDIPKH